MIQIIFMKKILSIIVSIAVIVGLSPIVSAPNIPDAAKNSQDKGQLTKIVFIHYKKGFDHKPAHDPGGKGNGGDSGPTCWTLLSKGAKWKTVENAVVNPTNSGLSESFLVENTILSRETWDVETSEEIFGNTVTIDYTADWDDDSPDDKNEYSFGSTSSNVIAVAVVWGYFYGPPGLREIIEYDVKFNKDIAWRDATVDPSVMDYLNIAVHETGHGAGLGDVYETACSEVTMYGYGSTGETKKRTLEQQDINGLHQLYPA
jgi:hypothetical protein